MNPHLLLLINNCWRQIANDSTKSGDKKCLEEALRQVEHTDALLRQYVPTDASGNEVLYAEHTPRRRR